MVSSSIDLSNSAFSNLQQPLLQQRLQALQAYQQSQGRSLNAQRINSQQAQRDRVDLSQAARSITGSQSAALTAAFRADQGGRSTLPAAPPGEIMNTVPPANREAIAGMPRPGSFDGAQRLDAFLRPALPSIGMREPSPTQPDEGTAETTPETGGAPASAEASALPDSAQLGSVNITNIRETTDEAGNRTGVVGEIDLSRFGLGTVEMDLQMEDGEVVGATSRQDQLSLELGGNSMTLQGDEGGDLLRIDQQGTINFSGSATINLGNQSFELGEVNLTAGVDEENNTVVNVEGVYNQGGTRTNVSASYNSNGEVTASLSTQALTDLVPGMDEAIDVLGGLGVDVTTENSAEVRYNPNEGSLAISGFGIEGSYNQDSGVFRLGGIEVDAGVGIELEELEINTQTGSASGSISAGLGVGIGDVGIGVDLAGFSFEYDGDSGDITLSGSQGVSFAEVGLSVDLSKDNEGIYQIDDLTFRTTSPDPFSQSVVQGLNTAFEQGGVQLANQALGEFQRMGRSAAGEFASALSQAGDQAGALIEQVQNYENETLENFLAGAANAGEELGNFLDLSDELSGDNLSNFLSAAASQSSDNVSAFIGEFASLYSDVSQISGGVSNLTVDEQGGIRGNVSVPGAGSMNVRFGRQNGNLTASGNLSLGGFQFSNASITFGNEGNIQSVSGGSRITVPDYGLLGSPTLGFELGLDASGNVMAQASFEINLGWLGRHGAAYTLRNDGISINAY